MADEAKTLEDVEVGTLGLPPNAVKALRDAGLPHLGAVARKQPAELLEISGVGPKTLHVLETALAEFADIDEPVDDGVEETPDDQPTAIDEPPAGRPEPKPTRPKPRPHPTPSVSPASRRPRGCLWVRVRKGGRQITTECRIPALRQSVLCRFYEGFRYAMPPDVEIGDVREWHRMMVRETVQGDYEPIELSQIDVKLWKIQRSQVADFLAKAQVIIERVQGKRVFLELMQATDGTKQVLARYKALREAHPDEKIPEVHELLDMNPLMPEGVVPIVDEDLVSLDRLAFGRTGQQYDNEHDLETAKVEEARDHEPPAWAKKLFEQQLEAAIASAPNALV